MGWNWNDAVGGAIDGFFSYGPYGAIVGGAIGGWEEDWDKTLTGDSNSGFISGLLGTGKSGGMGSQIMNSFDTNNGGYQGNQGTGANTPAWGTSDGFSWGSLLGNTGEAIGEYAGNRYGGSIGKGIGSDVGGGIGGQLGAWANGYDGNSGGSAPNHGGGWLGKIGINNYNTSSTKQNGNYGAALSGVMNLLSNYGKGGSMGKGTGGGDDLPANAGISFGDGSGVGSNSSGFSEVLGNTGSGNRNSGGNSSGFSGMFSSLFNQNGSNDATIPTSTGYDSLSSLGGSADTFGAIQKLLTTMPGMNNGQPQQAAAAPGGDLQAMRMAPSPAMSSPSMLSQVISAHLMNAAGQNRLAYMRPGRM